MIIIYNNLNDKTNLWRKKMEKGPTPLPEPLAETLTTILEQPADRRNEAPPQALAQIPDLT